MATMFTILLVLHVVIAALALGSGFVALFAPKGRSLHRSAGQVFVTAMLAMTAIAFVLALMHNDRISIVPSLLSFYLVATGFRTVTRLQSTPDAIDFALLVLAFAVAGTGYALGYFASRGPGGLDANGFPPTIYFAFASIALLAGALDLRQRVAAVSHGRHCLARHLWRMGLALLIATTSFFQGQDQVFPKPLQGTLVLELPPIAVIGMLLYWLTRLFLGSLNRPARPVADEPLA
jgi:uncharacterized membrane protein